MKPSEIINTKLLDLLDNRQRARNRNGVIWSDETFEEKEKQIQEYEKAINVLRSQNL